TAPALTLPSSLSLTTLFRSRGALARGELPDALQETAVAAVHAVEVPYRQHHALEVELGERAHDAHGQGSSPRSPRSKARASMVGALVTSSPAATLRHTSRASRHSGSRSTSSSPSMRSSEVS